MFLIPTPLGENDPVTVLPAEVTGTVCKLECFVVEELRSARRFLSKCGLKGHIDELELHTLNEHSEREDVEALIGLFDNGRDVGLLSEAGLPAVADPGAALVALCHDHGIRVIPLVGPSSLMMALMASGLNGQSFSFCGYLPAKTDARRAALRQLEKQSRSGHSSMIVIETPYRNDTLFTDMISTLSENTRICVAANLMQEDEFISTRTVRDWKKSGTLPGKRPCVFIFLA